MRENGKVISVFCIFPDSRAAGRMIRILSLRFGVYFPVRPVFHSIAFSSGIVIHLRRESKPVRAGFFLIHLYVHFMSRNAQKKIPPKIPGAQKHGKDEENP